MGLRGYCTTVASVREMSTFFQTQKVYKQGIYSGEYKHERDYFCLRHELLYSDGEGGGGGVRGYEGTRVRGIN